jgi:hypothetical protein
MRGERLEDALGQIDTQNVNRHGWDPPLKSKSSR